MKRYIAAAALTAIVAGCSDNNAKAQTSTELPVILQELEKQGLTIHGPLDAPGGLEAYAASAGTQALGVYLTPGSKYAIVGTLVDAAGIPVVEDQLQKIVSQPRDESNWANLEAARWVQDGSPQAERIVYAFMDANCPFCHEFWRSARPWVDAGKVQIRHVMVGIIRADSPAKAAAILGADNPEAALKQNAQSHESGGITPLKDIPPETTAILAENLELMRSLGFSGTPGIVAKAENGTLTYQPGSPRGPALEALFGPL